MRELDRLTAETGIGFRVVGFGGVGAADSEGFPDLVMYPQPGVVAEEGRAGRPMDLGSYLDVERLRQDPEPAPRLARDRGPDGSWPSAEGRVYGAFVDLNVKGLIWYPVPELRAAGYGIPGTWGELTALTDRLTADGRPPWCLGFASPPANGWPGTDWIENLVLTGSGPSTYDRWTSHEIPFDTAPVRLAFERLSRLLFTEGSVYLGPEGGAGDPVLAGPAADGRAGSPGVPVPGGGACEP